MNQILYSYSACVTRRNEVRHLVGHVVATNEAEASGMAYKQATDFYQNYDGGCWSAPHLMVHAIPLHAIPFITISEAKDSADSAASPSAIGGTRE